MLPVLFAFNVLIICLAGMPEMLMKDHVNTRVNRKHLVKLNECHVIKQTTKRWVLQLVYAHEPVSTFHLIEPFHRKVQLR